MSKIQLIITSTSFYKAIFRLKDDNLQACFFQDKLDVCINDIYYAKVNQILHSLGGCFVDLGNNKKAFLKFNKNNQALKIGESLFVQVVKKSTFPNKYPVVSEDIEIKTGLLVFKPKGKGIFFSKKILEKDRAELLNNIQQMETPKDFGLVIRSLYKYDMIEEAILEFHRVLKKWQEVSNHPNIGLIWGFDLLETVLFSYSSTKIPSNIISNNSDEIKCINTILNNYKYMAIEVNSHNNKEDILSFYDIWNDIAEIDTKAIQINDSQEIVFYEQEAFNYIDINFSGLESMQKSKEEGSYRVNMEISDFIVNQIILRNLTGQILIDLLKITNKQYKNNLLARFKKLFEIDDVKVSVLGFSHLGILEISRQKLEDSLNLLKNTNKNHHLFFLLLQIKSRIKEKINIKISNKDMNLFQSIAKKDIEEINSLLLYPIDFIIDDKTFYPVIYDGKNI